MDEPRIHPTALIEPGVQLGARTAVWDSAHIRGPASIGHDCIVGEKTYIAYDVRIGNLVKINAQVYICAGVTIADRVMISAGVIFTNDRYPRAFDPDTGELASSEPNDDTLCTTVGDGTTIGAGARIGPGPHDRQLRHDRYGRRRHLRRSRPWARLRQSGSPARLRLSLWHTAHRRSATRGHPGLLALRAQVLAASSRRHLASRRGDTA